MTDYDKWAKFEDEDGDEDAPSQQVGSRSRSILTLNL
eukprot:SAG11_NODE_3_length_39220_cov_67.005828_5_plen_37_part_00